MMNGNSNESDLVVTDLLNGDHKRNEEQEKDSVVKDGSDGCLSSSNPFSSVLDGLGLKDGSVVDSANNPFSSSLETSGFSDDPFSNMSGTASGLMKQHQLRSSSSGGAIDSLDGSSGMMNLSNEQFKQAIPSMFEESMSPGMFAKPVVVDDSNNERGDFMASTEHAWMTKDGDASSPVQPPEDVNVVHRLAHNPFMANKGDSGFISPACHSSHYQSASASEDSAENHEERRIEAAGDRPPTSVSEEKEDGTTQAKDKHANDDHDEDHREVTSYLSGGVIETEFGELMKKARRETPTLSSSSSSSEENESSLEEILAKARDQPSSVEPGLVEDVDSDETSSEASDSEKARKLPEDAFASSFQTTGGAAEQSLDSSSSSSDGGGVENEITVICIDEEAKIGQQHLKENDPIVHTEKYDTHEAEVDNKPEVLVKSALVPPPEQLMTATAADKLEKLEGKGNGFVLPTPQEDEENVCHQEQDPLRLADKLTPAGCTLNVIDDDVQAPEDSSGPSSLESQEPQTNAPSSVIVESQEVPVPDHASFIVKTSESDPLRGLPTPQEPVVELIAAEDFRESSQSPILEEGEECVMSDSEAFSSVKENGSTPFSNEPIGLDGKAAVQPPVNGAVVHEGASEICEKPEHELQACGAQATIPSSIFEGIIEPQKSVASLECKDYGQATDDKAGEDVDHHDSISSAPATETKDVDSAGGAVEDLRAGEGGEGEEEKGDLLVQVTETVCLDVEHVDVQQTSANEVESSVSNVDQGAATAAQFGSSDDQLKPIIEVAGEGGVCQVEMVAEGLGRHEEDPLKADQHETESDELEPGASREPDVLTEANLVQELNHQQLDMVQGSGTLENSMSVQEDKEQELICTTPLEVLAESTQIEESETTADAVTVLNNEDEKVQESELPIAQALKIEEDKEPQLEEAGGQEPEKELEHLEVKSIQIEEAEKEKAEHEKEFDSSKAEPTQSKEAKEPQPEIEALGKDPTQIEEAEEQRPEPEKDFESLETVPTGVVQVEEERVEPEIESESSKTEPTQVGQAEKQKVEPEKESESVLTEPTQVDEAKEQQPELEVFGALKADPTLVGEGEKKMVEPENESESSVVTELTTQFNEAKEKAPELQKEFEALNKVSIQINDFEEQVGEAEKQKLEPEKESESVVTEPIQFKEAKEQESGLEALKADPTLVGKGEEKMVELENESESVVTEPSQIGIGEPEEQLPASEAARTETNQIESGPPQEAGPVQVQAEAINVMAVHTEETEKVEKDATVNSLQTIQLPNITVIPSTPIPPLPEVEPQSAKKVEKDSRKPEAKKEITARKLAVGATKKPSGAKDKTSTVASSKPVAAARTKATSTAAVASRVAASRSSAQPKTGVIGRSGSVASKAAATAKAVTASTRGTATTNKEENASANGGITGSRKVLTARPKAPVGRPVPPSSPSKTATKPSSQMSDKKSTVGSSAGTSSSSSRPAVLKGAVPKTSASSSVASRKPVTVAERKPLSGTTTTTVGAPTRTKTTTSSRLTAAKSTLATKSTPSSKPVPPAAATTTTTTTRTTAVHASKPLAAPRRLASSGPKPTDLTKKRIVSSRNKDVTLNSARTQPVPKSKPPTSSLKQSVASTLAAHEPPPESSDKTATEHMSNGDGELKAEGCNGTVAVDQEMTSGSPTEETPQQSPQLGCQP